MALAYTSSPTTIRVTIKDNAGLSSVKDYVVPTSTWDPASDLFSALATIRDNLATVLNAVSVGLLFVVSIVVDQQEDTLILPAASCEITDIASVVANLSGGEGKSAVLQIPCPDIDNFQGPTGAAKNTVDILDTDLLAYIAKFQATGGDFTVSDGETIDDTTPLKSGKRISRKSSRNP